MSFGGLYLCVMYGVKRKHFFLINCLPEEKYSHHISLHLCCLSQEEGGVDIPQSLHSGPSAFIPMEEVCVVFLACALMMCDVCHYRHVT